MSYQQAGCAVGLWAAAAAAAGKGSSSSVISSRSGNAMDDSSKSSNTISSGGAEQSTATAAAQNGAAQPASLSPTPLCMFQMFCLTGKKAKDFMDQGVLVPDEVTGHPVIPAHPGSLQCFSCAVPPALLT
jgi:hypothetical protein